jgi:predicted double-glycine peptidase
VYVQLIAFPILVAGALIGGKWLTQRRFWWVGVAVGLMLFGLVIVGHRTQQYRFVAPVSWAVDADWSPLLMTAAVGVVFATLIPKLPQRRVRIWVGVLSGVMLVYYGLLPAVMPLLSRGRLVAAGNLMDRNGICRQQYAFACGPAAAVTCLGRLGIVDEEVGIAVEARSSPMFGTDGYLLAAAIERRHPGVQARHRYAATLGEVRTPAVAEMIMPVIGGHYIAILEIRGATVVVGDPMGGQQEMPREVFGAYWQHAVLEIGTGAAGGGRVVNLMRGQ